MDQNSPQPPQESRSRDDNEQVSLLLKLINHTYTIDIVNLETLDLNLPKVFEALASERSATRAGERVGLTQSSVSNALNRLRQVFGDDLFVRTPQGMVLTPRAQQLDRPTDGVRLALTGRTVNGRARQRGR